MRILLIGGGGREHALCWKLSQSEHVEHIFTTPGNPGTARVAKNQNISIPADEISALVAFASTEGIDLTVVGPEKPLALGIVDRFRERGLKILGPTQSSARLESSKSFAKEIMAHAKVPTASSELFTDFLSVKQYLEKSRFPIVLKEDGLAQGKGVLVAQDLSSAISFAQRAFQSPNKLLVEEFLEGEEVSFFVITDGVHFIPLSCAQDHKRLLDRDCGPNTGGMGAYSPAPIFTPALQREVERTIVLPVLAEMEKQGTPYTGILFVGLILTKFGPKVLEFNARFGDPETQVILPRLETDLVELFDRTVRIKLSGFELKWKSESALTVVLASEGYPGSPVLGDKIVGLGKTEDNMKIFHAGTKEERGVIVTSGGRVLSVTALGENLKQAQNRAYEAISGINFRGKQYRKDIGWRVLQ